MHFHGLAAPKTSADVDVLLAREDLDRVAGRLVTLGWRPRPWSDPDSIFPQHSVTYFHPAWPVDVDLHFRFPGCEAPPERVLDELLATSIHVQEAGVAARIPDAASSVIIEALHILRDSRAPRAEKQLGVLADSARRAVDGESAVAAARRLGALATADPFLRRAYPDAVPADPGRPSAEWLLFSRNTHAGSVRLEFLLHAQGRSVPGMLMRALWPTREALAATDLTIQGASSAQVMRRRFARLFKGLRELPIIVAETSDYFRASARYRRRLKAAEGRRSWWPLHGHSRAVGKEEEDDR